MSTTPNLERGLSEANKIAGTEATAVRNYKQLLEDKTR